MSVYADDADVLEQLERKSFNMQEVVTARGGLRLYRHSRDVYGSRGWGHMEVAHAELFCRYTKERVATTEQYCIHDWQKLTGYDTAARIALTQLGLDHLDRYEVIAVLVHSRIVSMGVSVAKMAMGGLKVQPYSDRSEMCAYVQRLLSEAPHANLERLFR